MQEPVASVQDQQQIDPRHIGHEGEYPDQKVPFPGQEAEMLHTPDHGETSYRGSGRLQGRSALVTGADSGIGRAVALAFAREGADVLIAYLDEEDDARETERLVTEAGRKAVLVAGDLRDEEFCKGLVHRAVDEFGKLDILVNNAAFQMGYKDITEVPTEEFDRAYKTNVYAMFWLCREAFTVMPPGGSIINTASVEAYQPKPILLPYASTKGAIVTFSKAFAQMCIEKGIRVNVVAPGPVWTPLAPMSLPPDEVKQFGISSPMKRAAQPFELSPIYVLLASNEASYMTGDVYGVAGGMYLA